MAGKTLTLVDDSDCGISGQYIVDGIRMHTFLKSPEEAAAIVRNVQNIKIRDDDVILATYPKSVLLNEKAAVKQMMKIGLMLEMRTETELDKQPSPRVLNSHLPLTMLPWQLKEKKTKVVWFARNPKDALVSYYYHIAGMKMFNFSGNFGDFLKLFFEDKLLYQNWFEYTFEFEKALLAELDMFHLIYFEDLKENGIAEIKRLATFLGVDADDELVSGINEKCSLKSLAAEKPEIPKDRVKNNFSIFRKGIIGDWKNHFTVAESDEFDRLYQEKMKESTLKFRFEPSTVYDKS